MCKRKRIVKVLRTSQYQRPERFHDPLFANAFPRQLMRKCLGRARKITPEVRRQRTNGTQKLVHIHLERWITYMRRLSQNHPRIVP